MTRSSVLAASIALCLPPAAFAKTSSASEVAELRRQVETLQAAVTNLQQQAAQNRLAPAFSTPSDLQPSSRGGASSPAFSEPVIKKTNLNIFNPELSAALDVIGSYSKRSKNVNFIARDAEVMLQANVDQLLHAYAVFNAETELAPQEQKSVFEDATLGLEEFAIETTALPFGLGVKAGQFFADVTRLGKTHSHELPFTDRPLSLEKIVGGEGKGRGVEVSWLPPIGHYVRITAGVLDNLGAEPTVTATRGAENEAFAKSRANRNWSDLAYYGRAVTIFELGPQSQLHVGGNFLTSNDTSRRQLTSGDFLFLWRPRAAGHDLLELGGEVLRGKSKGLFADSFTTASGQTGGTANAPGRVCLRPISLRQKLAARYPF